MASGAFHTHRSTIKHVALGSSAIACSRPRAYHGHQHRAQCYARSLRESVGFLDRTKTLAFKMKCTGGIQPAYSRTTRLGVISFLSSDAFFNIATVGVMPLYTMMIGFPKSQLTKRLIASPIPDLVLSIMYLYLLSQSWEPDTLRLIMNPDNNYLPTLSGIVLLFSRVTTVASAWVHLLAVDLFAAKQVYIDSLACNVPARHSIILCLMCCPVGILAHTLTKIIMQAKRSASAKDVAGSLA